MELCRTSGQGSGFDLRSRSRSILKERLKAIKLMCEYAGGRLGFECSIGGLESNKEHAIAYIASLYSIMFRATILCQ